MPDQRGRGIVLWAPETKDDWRHHVGLQGFFEKDSNGYSPYKQYLESRTWKRTRDKKIAEANGACERCGVRMSRNVIVHVHHKTYERVTRERMSDLELLCASCHQAHHESLRNRRGK